MCAYTITLCKVFIFTFLLRVFRLMKKLHRLEYHLLCFTFKNNLKIYYISLIFGKRDNCVAKVESSRAVPVLIATVAPQFVKMQNRLPSGPFGKYIFSRENQDGSRTPFLIYGFKRKPVCR